MTGMARGRSTIRLVIQRVQDTRSPTPVYGLIAYPAPKGTTLRPANFSSRDSLLVRLRSALPDLEPEFLPETLETQIVFAKDVELTNAQLLILGLVVQ
jgi:hypothetical protein